MVLFYKFRETAMKNAAKNAFQSANLTAGTKGTILASLTFLAAVLPAIIKMIESLPTSGQQAKPTAAPA